MFNDSDHDKLQGLAKRIGKAQEALNPAVKAEQGRVDPTSRGVVRAVKLGSDFVATILGMAFFGWLVDRQFGTAPWVMLVTISLGFVGSFWMLVRALGRKPASDMQEPSDTEKE